MMFLTFNANIWFYPTPVDFRKQLDSLMHLIASKLELNPTSGELFVFRNRLGDKLKMLYWDGLTHYLNDGRLEIDNNHTEREIKPFVIARKNFMFCNSQAGARALCLHFSLIRTAKLHGLDPYRYYDEVLKATPHCESVSDYEALLPWNIQLNKAALANAA